MITCRLNSIQGILAALEWPGCEQTALEKLKSAYDDRGNQVIDTFWHEVSEDQLLYIEKMAEDTENSCQKIASLIASKVHFHLGSYERAKYFALSAGNLFDSEENSDYSNFIVVQCIDSYKDARNSGIITYGEISDKERFISHREEDIVHAMFNKCLKKKQHRLCVGLAVETKRMDLFSKAVSNCPEDEKREMLSFALNISLNFIENRTFRTELVRCVYNAYKKYDAYLADIIQMLIQLDNPIAIGNIFGHLVDGNTENVLDAYKFAFELYESAPQYFLKLTIDAVKDEMQKKPTTNIDKATEIKESSIESNEPASSETPEAENAEAVMIDQRKKKLERIINILSGSETIQIHLKFLSKHDKTDKEILKQTKDLVRDSISHTATIIANGFMRSGTTHDDFLRDNIDWLARSTNWAKFSVSASLGVIHHGHEKDSKKIMQAYLPQGSIDNFGYAEGGGLYALGLIHANHGGKITEYLIEQLKMEGREAILKHGACLGLGAAAMGTQRNDVYDLMKENLYMDDAVVGEAAALAMGLNELGSSNFTAIGEMLAYARETQHEKIIRGIAIGIPLIMYGRLEEGETHYETLYAEKDAILRRSAVYTLALAYCGTGSNNAIRKLLAVAASDVNDDVRRAAVTSLGFILFKYPEKCPELVSLLVDSYNPFVRYGSAMALGIACAGTGNSEALALIDPMVRNDSDNLVRQGALIASALILIRHKDVKSAKVIEYRELYAKIIADKHEGQMVRLGAILAQGIIDAGGRNTTIKFLTRDGCNNRSAIVGMFIFLQYWYWFPLAHFLCLSFTPTCKIIKKASANEEIKVENVEYEAEVTPKDYVYPPPLETKKKGEKGKVATAILSTTAKQKKKDADKKKESKDGEGEEPGPPEAFEYSEE